MSERSAFDRSPEDETDAPEERVGYFALMRSNVDFQRLWAGSVASPLADALADRYSRRHLMIGSDLVHAVVVLGFLLIDHATTGCRGFTL